MTLEIIYSLIKYLIINLCIYYSYIKILNLKASPFPKKILLFFILVVLSFFESTLSNSSASIFRLLIMYIISSLLFGKFCNINFGNSLIVTIISISITYTIFFISSIISSISMSFFSITNITRPIVTMLTVLLQIILLPLLFKFKRLKNGMCFIKNKVHDDYIDIFALSINIIVLFMYFWLENYQNISLKYLTIGFALFAIIMIPIIQKTFTLYHKQKLQNQALKDYEQQLQESEAKLATALEDKQKLIKANHEFYHRQEALKKKLNDLIETKSTATNVEIAEEYSNILDRINTLSNEYSEKIKATPHLPKTNIPEIDDMLSYMQSESEKNNIEFLLKIECNISHITENFISKSQLETLLGDLLRNAIIAVNHSSNNFKSIMVVFGIKDSTYQLSVYDSGIEFEIDTLLNLGLKPSSTHTSEGGTGIGFITTFETLNSCNASFIINENTNNNYTKSLEIIFNNLNNYTIISNRYLEIEKLNISKRNIILTK